MYIPEAGPNVPRRGNWFFRWLGRLILRLIGWRIEGELPNVTHTVVVGAPHTSNFEGIIMLGTMFSMGLRLNIMGKDSLFGFPHGPLLRWIGMIPIDRSKANDVVSATAITIREADKLWICMAPEGTRKGADKWKSGFWHIARTAGVPILPVRFDYGRKVFTIGPVLEPGDDLEADLQTLYDHYVDAEPRHWDRLSGPLRRMREARGETLPDRRASEHPQ